MKDAEKPPRVNKKKVGKKAKNRSGDLVALADRFGVLKAKIAHLVAALHAQHGSMDTLLRTRLEVAKQVASISEKSPIFDHAGLLPGTETPKGAVTSYYSVHLAMHKRSTMYLDRYKQFIVDYATEWENVVVTRVSNDIKASEKIRLDLEHYQGKVEALRKGINQVMAKGKLVDPKQSEKLRRNEDKLTKARAEYAEFSSNLCVLIEEVTERAWKDLHPLLIKMSQFDATLSSDEFKLFSQLNQVTEHLKTIAMKHRLKPQARLKDLQELSARNVSTKGSESALRLEDGLAGPAGGVLLGSEPVIDTTLLPDRTGGGGILSPSGASIGSGAVPSLGGGSYSVDVPVAVPVSDPFMRSSSDSMGSYGAGSGYGSTTQDMMAVAAHSAPPPTMEMLNDATSNMGLNGTLPPRPPSASSFGYGSDAGSLTAAPVSAPPPPPPPFSMYDASTGMGGPGMAPPPGNPSYQASNASPDPYAPMGGAPNTAGSYTATSNPFGY